MKSVANRALEQSLNFLQHIVRLTLHNNTFFDQIQLEPTSQNSSTTDAVQILLNHFNQSSHAHSNLTLHNSSSSSGGLNSNNNNNSSIMIFDSIKEEDCSSISSSVPQSGFSPHSSPVSRSPAFTNGFMYNSNSSNSLSSLNGTGTTKKKLETPAPKTPVHKNLLNFSKEFSSEDEDSDSDTASTTSSSLYSNSIPKRLSISPRSSLSLSGSIELSASTMAMNQSSSLASLAAANSREQLMMRPRRGSTQESPLSISVNLFESLVEDLDYSKTRKEELLNQTTEDKWQFLQRLKPDCTTTLISNGIFNNNNQLSSSSSDLKSILSSPPKLNGSTNSMSSPKAPPSANIGKSFPRSPRSITPLGPSNNARVTSHSLFTIEDISKLRLALTEKPVNWVINFAESSGINAILNMISIFSKKESKIEDDHLVINECLSCIKLLSELELHSILLTDTTDTIVPLMVTPSLSVKRATFEVLDSLCKVFPVGSSVVMESLRTFARNTEVTLQQTFKYIIAPLAGEFAADLKVNCMSLINHLIRGCKDVALREDVRTKFLDCEILKIIKSLRIDGEGIETSSWKRLEVEMSTFETLIIEDEIQLSPRCIEYDSGGEETGSVVGSDPKLPVLISCSPEEGSSTLREVLVPITKKSQAADVIRTITSSNSNLKELGEWGLYVRETDKPSESGRFLRDEEYLTDQQYDGASDKFREYSLKMVPWKVRVNLERIKEMGVSAKCPANFIVEEPMDPTLTCARLVDHLVTSYLPQIGQYALESDDFGLYLDSFGFGTGTTGYWLEPLEKLHVNSEIFKDPKCTVALRLRLKLVKLKFADDSFEQLRLDLMLQTEKIFKEISEKVVDPENSVNVDHYSIFVDRQDQSSGAPTDKKNIEWIEPGRPLYHYRISNRVCLRFAVRPSPITLMIDASLFNSPETADGESTSSNNPDENELESKAATVGDVASLMMSVPQPIKTKTIQVQIPLHLPLQESLDTELNWLECKIDQAKCRFHIDSFDGPIINQHQPLLTQYFTKSNKLFVELADEADLVVPQYVKHNATNIWEEVNDRTTIFFDVDPVTFKLSNVIRGATLNKLVEVSTNNIDVDRVTMNILLMTYTSFTTSDTLLDKLIERYNVPERLADTKNVVQLHVIVFIKNWLEQQSPQAASGGGLEERFLERINQFIERMKEDGYSNMVPQLKRLIDMAIKEKRAYAMPEVPRLTTVIRAPSISTAFLEDELFVAQQLTLREFETFRRIQPVEFLNQAWNKPKLQYKACNLLKMIDRFNRVSLAISTSILAQIKLKSRVKLICRYIKIALHLRELNNFHLLTAFLAGIRNSSVLRLRVSWSKVPKKYKQSLEDLEKLMSMEGSFKTFRSLIKDLVPPCIPYLGVYLKDLTFIEDGNNDSMDGLINWGKKKLVYNIISIIQSCQYIPYDFGPPSSKAEQVLASFDSLPVANDEVLYQMSQQLEPKI
ncbi:Ras guanine nucleotide exchange factor [Heterostelium album PN500]|uniref:Ras guanine nucleotide exchange factor n=1 Tax=Heterostelium pallidum (strain ATCC 26659 / Pp 5 / PN500) TaxID=670386 RepID=D3B1J8_HETP5|nr:Ras guanine nucleotide exchange factor [Heterostelium album PN500]EFA85172.1 Ras guanine nucleotide exchange factor [Heterostelium album PN500]|eukprot:XP_020437281.1 Ras guanine nucleotide exchange factor [Heterostelium album PN500]